MEQQQQQRKLTINQTVNVIDNAFCELHYYNSSYGDDSYPYRIYPDGSMIVQDCKTKLYYQLTWSIGDNNSVTFSDKSTWVQVEESYIPVGEIGARSKPPFEKIQSRGQEKRYYSGLESRMNEGGEGMEGLGIVTESTTLLYTLPDGRKIYEKIARSAIENYDLGGNDIIATFNHDNNFLLARTSSNTLAVVKEANGLRYSIPSLPNTTYGNDLKEMLSRGDIKGSSFEFYIADGGETWTEVEGGMLRTITEFRMITQVGPVVNEAYHDTTAAKRSLDNFCPIEVKQLEEQKNDLWEYQLRHFQKRNDIRK